jgi:hypothetical protein
MTDSLNFSSCHEGKDWKVEAAEEEGDRKDYFTGRGERTDVSESFLSYEIYDFTVSLDSKSLITPWKGLLEFFAKLKKRGKQWCWVEVQ